MVVRTRFCGNDSWVEAGRIEMKLAMGQKSECGAHVHVEGTENAKSLMWERTWVFNTLSNVSRAY